MVVANALLQGVVVDIKAEVVVAGMKLAVAPNNTNLIGKEMY